MEKYETCSKCGKDLFRLGTCYCKRFEVTHESDPNACTVMFEYTAGEAAEQWMKQYIDAEMNGMEDHTPEDVVVLDCDTGEVSYITVVGTIQYNFNARNKCPHEWINPKS